MHNLDVRLIRIREYIGSWLTDGYALSPQALASYRIGFSAVYLIALFPQYSWIGGYPDAFWRPPMGPYMLLDGFPPKVFFHLLEWGLAAALIALLVGYRTTLASLTVGTLLITGDGFVYAFGKIDHLIHGPVVPLLLAFSGWGAIWSVDARRHRGQPTEPASVALLMLALGSSMAHAGVSKALGGWLDPSSSAVASFVVSPSAAPAFFGAAFLKSPTWIHEAFDWFTVALECGFLFAVFAPKMCRLFIAFATLFHLGVFLLLGISFVPLLVLYALLLPWQRIAASGRQVAGKANPYLARAKSSVTAHPVAFILLLTMLYVGFITVAGPPIRGARTPSLTNDVRVSFVAHAIAAVCGSTYLASALAAKVRSARRHPVR